MRTQPGLVAALALCTGLTLARPLRAADQLLPLPTPDPSAAVATSTLGPIESHTLANGLRVVLSPQSDTARVAVDVVYHCGFRDQPAGYSGLPHIVEHAMFDGSLHVPPQEFIARLERAGATYVNGETSIDRTEYLEAVPAEHLPLVLWMESDRMAYMLDSINEARLANVRRTVQNEFLTHVASVPAGNAVRFLYASLFPATHPYHSLLDDDSDLDAIGLPDVQWFFQQYYSPANATLIVAGNFDAVATLAMIERYFATIRPSTTASPRARPAAPQAPAGERRIELDVPMRRGPILLGWVTPAYLADGDAALDVVADLLVNAPHSGLRATLVEAGAIAESVVARQRSAEYASVFVIRVMPRAGAHIATVLPMVDRALDWIKSTALEPADVQRAAARHALALREGWQDPLARARLMAGYEAQTGRPDGLARDLTRYEALDPAAVLRAAQTFLATERRVVETIYPAARAPLAGRLAIAGPVTGGAL